jgi:hypothetical protein
MTPQDRYEQVMSVLDRELDREIMLTDTYTRKRNEALREIAERHKPHGWFKES